MTTSADAANNGAPASPEQIREEIERTRAQLAETVDRLHAKADVKDRTRARAEDIRQRATTASGKPRPELLAAAAGVAVVAVAVACWRHRFVVSAYVGSRRRRR